MYHITFFVGMPLKISFFLSFEQKVRVITVRYFLLFYSQQDIGNLKQTNKKLQSIWYIPVPDLSKRERCKQGCGSGLIQYGSGSSIFAKSGSSSGSGSKLKQNFSQIFVKSKFESNQIKNTGVFHQFFPKK
jgi:hypothetical protein